MALVSEVAALVWCILMVLVWFCRSNRALWRCGGHPKACLVNQDKYIVKRETEGL